LSQSAWHDASFQYEDVSPLPGDRFDRLYEIRGEYRSAVLPVRG